MPQANENFPIATPGTQQKQLYIHDVYFLNYHINHDKWNWFRMYDITEGHRDCCDFDVYDTGHWTVINTGAATEALTDLVNGVILLTNAAADDDLVELIRVAEAWKLVTGYPLYAEIRFKVSDATQSDFYFGLIDGGAGGYYAGVDNGVYFRKDDGDANIDFCTEYNTAVDANDTGVDLEDLTWIRLGFHWDGHDSIRYFVIRDSDRYILATGITTTYVCQDEELKLGFGLRNGEAVAKVMYVDYTKICQKRAIE